MRALVMLALVGACRFEELPALTDGRGGGDDDGGGPCTGLECNVVNCGAQPPTSISGTVFLPNGVVPLSDVSVYVPNGEFPLAPQEIGPSCTPCGPPPGDPIQLVKTGVDGTFVLQNVPSGDNIPVVISTGKWRRQLSLPHVEQCTNTEIPAEHTRLPKSRQDNTSLTIAADLPRIAISTGNADSLECLFRKMGIDDIEFNTGFAAPRMSLFSGNGASMLPGGVPMAPTSQLWDSLQHLTNFDMVVLSCEGAQQPSNKPQTSRDAMKAYVDSGGRLFLSHWQNIWIEGDMNTPGSGPPAWQSIAEFNNSSTTFGPAEDVIDTSHAAGQKFADWQQHVSGATPGRVPIASGTGKNTVRSIDTSKATRWTYWQMGMDFPQNFSFTVPAELGLNQRCGRVAFSDMHVSAASTSNPSVPFPGGCSSGPLAPQELALVYMLFDLGTCVGP